MLHKTSFYLSKLRLIDILFASEYTLHFH